MKTLPLLAAALLLSLSTAQAKPSAELTREKARCTAIERYAQSRPGQARYFADTNDDPREGSPRWRELKPKKSGPNTYENSAYYFEATAWARSGKLVLTEMTTSSPSGDWSRRARYFFREDGTLAKLDSTLSTFHTEDGSLLRQISVRYYSGAGRVLSTSTTYQDAKFKPKPPIGHQKNEPPVYKRASALPFYALLLKPRP